MKVRLALLADYANVTTEGKLNILGIFDRISVAKVPAVHPLMQFVLRLEARPAEVDRKHSLEIRLHGPDGGTVFDIKGEMMLQGRGPGEPVYTNQIITLNNLQLPEIGGYNFVVFIDNDLKTEVPLAVDRAPTRQTGSTAPSAGEGGGPATEESAPGPEEQAPETGPDSDGDDEDTGEDPGGELYA